MHSIMLVSTIFCLAASVLGVTFVDPPGASSLAQIPEIVDEAWNASITGGFPGPGEEDEALIAVMGPTGSGKTTFINLASGSDLRIGHGLESCTSVVQAAVPFELDGRLVTLLDTPGFDDTSKSDTEILRMISLYLSTMYEHGIKLTGVIYMHRISDYRVGGISRRNFNMFRELCGDDSLKNVLIVTNMWDHIDFQVGLERENELRSKDMFFKPALDKGARLFRHDKSVKSAHDIIRYVMENKPIALRIQQEIVDEKMEIDDTGAGRLLNKELREQIEKHRKDIEELHVQMEAAIQAHDEETRRELEIETLKLQKEMERIQEDTVNMAANFNRERAELEERMKEAALAAKREAERAAEEHRRDMEKVRDQLQKTEASMIQERNMLTQRMDAMRRDYEHKSKRRRGLLGRVGDFLDDILGS